MEYILFIHNDVDAVATKEQWELFFSKAKKSDVFQGGSKISNPNKLGKKETKIITDTIGGFMRFKSQNKNEILSLLEYHLVLIQGGTLELCEMPKT